MRADQFIYLSGSDYTSVPEGSQPEPAALDPTPGLGEADDAGDAEEGEGPKILSKRRKSVSRRRRRRSVILYSAWL